MTSHFRRRRLLRAAGSAAFLTLLAPAATRAVILRVPDDHATLPAAVAAAAPGDEIWVSEAGDPYILDAPLILADGVKYRGGWDAGFNDQDAARTRIALAVDSTGSVIDASLTSTSVTFASFTIGPTVKPATWTTVQGAGLFVGGASPLILSCIFENNVARDTGGGIQFSLGSAAEIRDCRFRDNEAGLRGGAIAIPPGADDVLFEACRFEQNLANPLNGATSAGGGAVFTRSGIRLERCTFRGNYCGWDGGALYVRDANIRSWGNLFYDNVAWHDGGAIYHQNGDGAHWGTLIEDCQAGVGGSGNGGAVCFERGSNRFHEGFVRRCTALQGNGFISGVGGAFYLLEPLSFAAIRRTEISGNRALAGGGIAIQGGTGGSFTDASIESNTIMGNFVVFADASRCTGAGIHVFDNFLGEVVNNIIAQQEDGSGIGCEGLLAQPNVRYNCVWNDPAANTDPEYGGSCADRTGINGNIRANPRFCCFVGGCVPVGPSPSDVQLSLTSPCLTAGEGGVAMGAYPTASDCTSPVSLEPASWGEIKARYR